MSMVATRAPNAEIATAMATAVRPPGPTTASIVSAAIKREPAIDPTGAT
jgi:hypothetical protein